MAEPRDDRTQPATQRRRDKARSSGEVPLSREVPGCVGLAATSVLIAVAGPSLTHRLTDRLAALLAVSHTLDPLSALRESGLAALLFVAPIVCAVLLTSVASTLLQTGFALRRHAGAPDFSRIDPRAGLRRIYGVGGLVEQGKALVKFAVLAWAAWHMLSGAVPLMAGAMLWLPGQIVDHLSHEMLRLMLTLLAAQVAIAGVDLAWVRYQHAGSLRMSREEVRQDNKESEGNPQVKARLRQLRAARAKQRMMAAVPTATVVVTNPTHYAIALAYDRNRPGAPRVVAKGADEMAARIRETAAEHRVPVVANPPLARALFTVSLDAEIPPEHFKAVAEIIAYIWRLRGRAR